MYGSLGLVYSFLYDIPQFRIMDCVEYTYFLLLFTLAGSCSISLRVTIEIYCSNRYFFKKKRLFIGEKYLFSIGILDIIGKVRFLQILKGKGIDKRFCPANGFILSFIFLKEIYFLLIF